MTEDRLTELRDKLMRTCEGHDADESIMGSALTTLIIGCTAVREAALAAFERITQAMRQHIEDAARSAEKQ